MTPRVFSTHLCLIEEMHSFVVFCITLWIKSGLHVNQDDVSQTLFKQSKSELLHVTLICESTCSGKSTCTPSRHLKVSSALSAKQFQCSGDWWQSLQAKVTRASSFYAPLPQRSMVWCIWLCAHRKCLKHLNTSDLRKMSQAPRSKPLGLLCQPLTIAHLEKQLDFKHAWSSCVFNVELLFWVSYGPTLMNSCYMHTQTVPSPS